MKLASQKFFSSGRLLLALVVTAGILFWLWPRATRPGDGSTPAGPVTAATHRNSSGVSAIARGLSAAALKWRESLFPDFQERPFPVRREHDGFGWTAADGRKPAVIRRLAHNELEFERMAGENDRIYRRQLVYSSETADLLVQRARLSGQPIRQLTLPGLDGREIRFEITRSDLSASGQQGTFSGHVAGRPDSMVTFAFKGGREAFTILSPADGLYLVGEPREPGELIVKSINPATYVVGVCGNP